MKDKTLRDPEGRALLRLTFARGSARTTGEIIALAKNDFSEETPLAPRPIINDLSIVHYYTLAFI